MKGLGLFMNEIKWGALIPLIGGFPLGAERSIGKPPETVMSYTGFWANDSQYMNYQNNTLGRSIPYINLTENDSYSKKLDIVVATPPCAALSQLNTGKSAEVKGSGCAKNEWMYQSLTDAIVRNDAEVYICENAPALYTTKGAGVAKRLEEIAHSFGRSITFYKTSTIYHGVPQARDRTFAFVWKSEHAPILNWYKRDRENFAEYLNHIKPNMIQQDLIVNPKVANECYYVFMKHHLGKSDCRSDIHEAGCKTAFQYVHRKGLLDIALKWFEETDNESGIKYAMHAKKKFADGLGIWDGSVHIANEYTQAWIGRNMNDTIHPTEDRSLTIRESLHMMAFPNDFELIGGRKNTNMIAQNVPVCTAADMVTEAIAFIRGERQSSGLKTMRQNNHSERIDSETKSTATLEEFM